MILDAGTMGSLEPMQQVDLAAFFSLHFLYVLVSLILLLNLLIALLTYTFDALREEAILRSRLIFAQKLMRYELLAASLGMRTR